MSVRVGDHVLRQSKTALQAASTTVGGTATLALKASTIVQNINDTYEDGHDGDLLRVRQTHRPTNFNVSAPGRRRSRCRDGLAGASRVPRSQVPTSRSPSSLLLQASSTLLLRGETPVGHGSAACSLTRDIAGNKAGETATRLSGNRRLTHLTVRFGETAATSGGATEGAGPSVRRRSSRAARVTVRRAKEQDYQGVAEIREVIVPVGMSGATGFMGGKVVVDSLEEAEKRLLMAKVWVCALMGCRFGSRSNDGRLAIAGGTWSFS